MSTKKKYRDWFSYSTDYGFETHETEEDARQSALDVLWEYRNEATDDGWSDEVHSIKIGRVTDFSIETDRRKSTPGDGSDCDELVEYGISESPDGALIKASEELLAACKEALARTPYGSKTLRPMLESAIAKATGKDGA